MMNDKIQPLPEIVAPVRFEVRELPRGGHTSRASGVYAAPFDDSFFGRAIRLHEYLHLKYSPDAPEAKRHGVSEEALLAVEDARVNEAGARLGYDWLQGSLDDPSVNPPHPGSDLRGATLFLIAAHGTGTYARARARLLAWGDAGRVACNLAELALRQLEEPEELPGFDATIRIARLLDRRLGAPAGASGRGPHAAHGCGIELLVRADGEAGPRGDGAPRAARAVAAGWGALRKIEEPPRTVACPRAGALRRTRATDEGTHLRWPHRFVVDRRVFARQSRLPGGSVLIDASGSMHLTPAALLELVEVAAGALVACYDGAREGFGEIRVLALAGRRVADRLVAPPTRRGGNVIDGPALRWLATRPAPRIWVSDGVVTGVGDAGSPALTLESIEICRQAAITRVASVAEARKLLGRPAAR